MEQAEQPARPVLSSYEDLARMIDYPLLDSTLTEEEVDAGCREARESGLGMVTVRPADVALAGKRMQGSGTVLGSVVSFPAGDETTAVKLYAIRDLVQRGAQHIETVLNTGKMLSRQFQYVELELLQMAQECHRADATLTVDLEWPRLGPDHRVIACKIVKRVEADAVRAASMCAGVSCGPEDLSFLIARLGDVRVDAGLVNSWEQATAAHQAGADGVVSTAPRGLLEGWRAELQRRAHDHEGV